MPPHHISPPTLYAKTLLCPPTSANTIYLAELNYTPSTVSPPTLHPPSVNK